MNRIANAFASCASANRAAFIPFIMGGDPSLEDCAKLLGALPEAGADIIELGIPFSDPMADGPVIQAAGLRALNAGTTLKSLLDMVRTFRKTHSTPIVLMGYVNPIYIYGYEDFARDAAAAGVDGLIIVDVPPEEAAEIEPLLTKSGVAFVRLIAPTSVPARLPLLSQGASGYLYYISITGITGAASASAAEVETNLAAVRKATNLPVCVGFGVKTAEDVKGFANIADGVVVGSAIVRFIEESHADVGQFRSFVRSLADGCQR